MARKTRQMATNTQITSDIASAHIASVVGLRFIEFMSAEDLAYINSHRQDKGVIGIVLERLCGLPQNSRPLDFIDGADLKSVHTTATGDPRESIAITQAGLLDDIIDGHADFATSHVGEKVRRTLLVGICRNGRNPENWFFTFCFMMDLSQDEWSEFAEELEDNYGFVQDLTQERLERNGRIRGTDGRRHVLQIRTKDSKDSHGNYHPIVSEAYGEVANKRHAWYLTRYGARRIVRHGLALQVT